MHQWDLSAQYNRPVALKDVLSSSVRPGELVRPLDATRIRCVACGHACPLPDGAAGVCKVRFNRGGTLFVPWGYVGGVQCDPIEKKPFFHASPGALAYSFGCSVAICTAGTRTVTARAARSASGAPPQQTSPERSSRTPSARARVCWSRLQRADYRRVAIFREGALADETKFVSNGNATPEVLGIGPSTTTRST
jgi:pyruvate formate lyase activating enzyme